MKFGIKEKKLCNGKLVVTNFKRLNPENFMPLQNFTKEELRKQLAICTTDGKIYVNTGIEGYELISGIFENFIPETRSNLMQYQAEYSKKFPNIKTIDDWMAWAATEVNKEQIVHALAVLMVSCELERRKIENSYYGKIRAFHH